MSLLQEAQAMEQEIIGWRRYFHENPELGLELPKTAAKVQEELKKMGVRFRPCGQSGVLGYIGKEGGKSILLRGDMDALPLTEDTGLPYASQCPGKMHACGHDTHAAMLLGAAKLLKAHEEELQGLVILMFQPGEETLSGARSMIEDGCLENPKPDHAVAIHIAGEPYQTGQVKLSRGTIAASSDNYRIILHGKGGHGASPQNSINPIFAAAKIVEQHPKIVICGTHDGYFKESDPVAREVAAAQPDLLFVCLGAPKQEKWIARFGLLTGAKMAIGLGGALDVFAGNVERAPEKWQKMGMEWAYRLSREPKRFGRMAKLPLVLVKAAGQRVTGRRRPGVL